MLAVSVRKAGTPAGSLFSGLRFRFRLQRFHHGFLGLFFGFHVFWLRINCRRILSHHKTTFFLWCVCFLGCVWRRKHKENKTVSCFGVWLRKQPNISKNTKRPQDRCCSLALWSVWAYSILEPRLGYT